MVPLHGGFGAIEMFAEQTEALLAAGRQVIGVDLQAHGSPAPWLYSGYEDGGIGTR